MRAHTVTQTAARLLPVIDRPVLTPPRYTPGSRIDPTGSPPRSKEAAAAEFQTWFNDQVFTNNTIAFSDGSVGTDGKGFGYVLYRGGQKIARGCASIHHHSVVFDAEAVGAWRALEHAVQLGHHRLPTPGYSETFFVCLDNTAAIWSLRGTPSLTSQWAFLRFHQMSQQVQVQVKWCPGHMGIQGNEEADGLAKEGQKAEQDPDCRSPTVGGIKAIMHRQLRVIRDNLWQRLSSRLSARYKAWDLHYDVRCSEELALPRPYLHRFLATRTGHGDFKWYHEKFRHNANLSCSCGYDKTPRHIVHCRRNRALFDVWPWPWNEKDRPKRPLVTSRQREEYLRAIMNQPQQWKQWVEATGFYTDICPR